MLLLQIVTQITIKDASNDLKTGQQPETMPDQSLTKFEAKTSSKTAASNSNR